MLTTLALEAPSVTNAHPEWKQARQNGKGWAAIAGRFEMGIAGRFEIWRAIVAGRSTIPAGAGDAACEAWRGRFIADGKV